MSDSAPPIQTKEDETPSSSTSNSSSSNVKTTTITALTTMHPSTLPYLKWSERADGVSLIICEQNSEDAKVVLEPFTVSYSSKQFNFTATLPYEIVVDKSEWWKTAREIQIFLYKKALTLWRAVFIPEEMTYLKSCGKLQYDLLKWCDDSDEETFGARKFEINSNELERKDQDEPSEFSDEDDMVLGNDDDEEDHDSNNNNNDALNENDEETQASVNKIQRRLAKIKQDALKTSQISDNTNTTESVKATGNNMQTPPTGPEAAGIDSAKNEESEIPLPEVNLDQKSKLETLPMEAQSSEPPMQQST